MNESEKKVVNKMITIYCRTNHKPAFGLCDECLTLNGYAMKRLENCPFGENKPTCGSCTIHCYKSEMRQKIKEVMRFAGPRMLLHHPIDAIRHFYKEYKRDRLYAVTEKNSRK
ncbi:MAG: nitrous oxide-stimulated promoter family protein [Bacteroidia bacterium]|nr:nitrous oxide-stimulated promoter family protein [Bacteroidia bacterium]